MMKLEEGKSARVKGAHTTHLDPDVVSMLRSASYVTNSLDAGSKNRYRIYCNGLCKSRGVDEPGFDVKLYHALKPYVLNPKEFKKVKQYLRTLKDPDGWSFSRDLRIYNKVSKSVSKFLEKDYTSFRWNRHYQNALKKLTSALFGGGVKLTPIKFTCDDDVRRILPKLDTHSGFTMIESGDKQKGENLDGIYSKLKAMEDEALETGTFNRLMLVGFRTQTSGEFEDDGTFTNTCKHKVRLILMVDLQIICEEIKFSRVLQDLLASKPFYGGGKDLDRISILISGWRTKYNKFLSIDYSSFDQTISSWLIEDVFSVIKSGFILTDRESKLFDIMVHDFIHKKFVLNEGLAQVSKGVPSGSMFTQIVDSLVNYVVISTYFDSMEDQKFEMNIMGDDNIIFCSEKYSIEELASYVRKNFGLDIKTDDKSNEGISYKDDPKYLSMYFSWKGRWRHPYQLISRMLYYERYRYYDDLITPYHVIYSYILAYPLGMSKLINIKKFNMDHPISKATVLNLRSQFMPSIVAYYRDYAA